MFNLRHVKNASGVYLMLDLDDQPVYAGHAKRVRARLGQHFERQSSNVVADGLLDIYEVRTVVIWYRAERPPLPFEAEIELKEKQPLEIWEAAVCLQHKPKWNRNTPICNCPLPPMPIKEADLRIEIVETPEDLLFRNQPLQRTENKLLHMLRAVRKARISGASPKVWRALAIHAKELTKLCERGHPPFRVRDDTQPNLVRDDAPTS
jgi:hypothetical protein